MGRLHRLQGQCPARTAASLYFLLAIFADSAVHCCGAMCGRLRGLQVMEILELSWEVWGRLTLGSVMRDPEHGQSGALCDGDDRCGPVRSPSLSGWSGIL